MIPKSSRAARGYTPAALAYEVDGALGTGAKQPRNPYIAGNPVGDGPAFVGRGDILRSVHRVLRDPERRGVVLYGQRRIGKTSILQHLHASLNAAPDGAYRAVYTDLQDKAKWSLGEVLVDQARGIAKALGLAPPVAEGDAADWFREAWLPAVLSGLPAQTSLVILFDEFDVLADVRSEHAASALFPYLRRLLEEMRGRVRFIFVIGRNIADLANVAHALFKSLPAERVGLLARDDAAAVMRMSEANGSMRWDDGAVEAAWALTSGHPYLLQQLCWELWHAVHDEADDEPRATAADVGKVVARTLDSAAAIFEWIWMGLPPAERVVASALAGAGERAISQEALEQLLHDSGVRVVMRELRDAPQLLADWDLIEPVEGGYRFRVELLRRWIARAKPLNRVQKDLDQVEPIAERYYTLAELHYKQDELDMAATLLAQALARNPNHVRAGELLADVLIVRRDWAEARSVLEQLHARSPSAARDRLVQVLLAQAEAAADDDKIPLVERALEVQKKHPRAEAMRRQVWIARGARARSEGRLRDALAAYREAGDADETKTVAAELEAEALGEAMDEIAQLERDERWAAAYEALRKTAAAFPNVRDWTAELERLEEASFLDTAYRRGLDAAARRDRSRAIAAFLEVIQRDATYRDVTGRLHGVVTGVEPRALQERLVVAEDARASAEREAKHARAAADRALLHREAEISEARVQIAKLKEDVEDAKHNARVGLVVSSDQIGLAAAEEIKRAHNEQARMRSLATAAGAVAVVLAVGLAAVVKGPLDSANGSVKQLQDDLKSARTEVAAAEASSRAKDDALRKMSERVGRVAKTGEISIDGSLVTVNLRTAAGDCAESAEYLDAPPAGRICSVTLDLTLVNDVAGIREIQGPLCLKHIRPNGTIVIEPDPPVTKARQGGGPCTRAVLLNTSNPTEMTKSVAIDEASFTVTIPSGSATGKSYAGQVGEHRFEIWWQDRKIGERTFRVTAP